MIYTVKPIKKSYVIFRGTSFAIEVDLHPNQRWTVYESGDDLYVSKDNFTIKMSRHRLNKYFREVEE